MRRRQDTQPYPPETPPDEYGKPDGRYGAGYDVEYDDPSRTDFGTDEYADAGEEPEDSHRFHVALNVFDLISILAGVAVILVLVAILVSLVTWLQGDISQSLTLLTSNLK